MSSRPIAARLNDDIPDEARALAVYDAWIVQGSDPRTIITYALLALAESQPLPPPDQEKVDLLAELQYTLQQAQELKGLSSLLKEARELVAALKQTSVNAPTRLSPPTDSADALSDELKSSMRKARRPGLRLNE